MDETLRPRLVQDYPIAGWDGFLLKDVQAAAVVALVRKAVVDELVVVDALARGPVVASLLGVLEVRDVPDVGNRVAVCAKASAVVLVILIILVIPVISGVLCSVS